VTVGRKIFMPFVASTLFGPVCPVSDGACLAGLKLFRTYSGTFRQSCRSEAS